MKSILPMVDFVFLNPTKWIEIMVSHLLLLHHITVIHTFPMIMDIIKIIQVAHTMNKTKANLQENKKKIRNQEINKKQRIVNNISPNALSTRTPIYTWRETEVFQKGHNIFQTILNDIAINLKGENPIWISNYSLLLSVNQFFSYSSRCLLHL